MSFPKITIGILLYRSIRYLPFTLPMIIAQNYPNLEILMLDNGNGEGGEYDYVRKNYPHIKVQKAPNLGFGGGHNFLMRQAQGEFYFCLNDDILPEYDFVRELWKAIDKDPHYAVATGKLRCWDFENRSRNQGKTDRIDTVGLKFFRSHRFEDEGQGQRDKGQYEQKRDIFGASGAAVLLRMEALRDIAAPQFFDESMFMYKEDIDLMYRLRWAGWKAIYTPRAVAYHDRSVSNARGDAPLSILRNRKDRPRNIKEWSYLNHHIMLQKNWDRFSWRVRLATLWYQFKTYIYIFLFERYLLKQKQRFQALKPDIQRCRAQIKRRVSPSEIEQWMQ